ncbi:MAG: hypothetical protein VW405_02825 [Rhodospirillaceae bacterium]
MIAGITHLAKVEADASFASEQLRRVMEAPDADPVVVAAAARALFDREAKSREAAIKVAALELAANESGGVDGSGGFIDVTPEDEAELEAGVIAELRAINGGKS